MIENGILTLNGVQHSHIPDTFVFSYDTVLELNRDMSTIPIIVFLSSIGIFFTVPGVHYLARIAN